MRASLQTPPVRRMMQDNIQQCRKWLRGKAMISQGIVPKLVLSQRVLDRIHIAASQFVAYETGEAMVGFVTEDSSPEGLPTITVLDTISPDETAVRRSHTFQQGDALQDEIIWWLQENWQFHRQRHRGSPGLSAEFDVPLRYLGDWHKQPGSMIQPSHGDLLTAINWLADSPDADFLLVPIVTIGHVPNIMVPQQYPVNFITMNLGDGTDLRIDWWYIHRDVRFFQPLSPEVLPESQLPQMMEYCWHNRDPDRLDYETWRLQEDGRSVHPLFFECNDDVPLEYCFLTIRPGARYFLLLVTEYDYPHSPPKAYQAAYTPELDLDDPHATFELLWGSADELEDPPNWHWSSDKSLADYVIAIEIAQGLRQPTSIPVSLLVDGAATHAESYSKAGDNEPHALADDDASAVPGYNPPEP